MASRGCVCFVGNLPGDVREREIEDLFYKVRTYYGRCVLCEGFLEDPPLSQSPPCSPPLCVLDDAIQQWWVSGIWLHVRSLATMYLYHRLLWHCSMGASATLT